MKNKVTFAIYERTKGDSRNKMATDNTKQRVPHIGKMIADKRETTVTSSS